MTMDPEEVRTELDQIAVRLQEDGLAPGASAEERQCHLWRELLRAEAKFNSAVQELQTLRTQQANEMKEVESYVEHIRGLLEERECLTAEYERDNEQLRLELQQISHQQENQSKELAEMLAQEDLGEMGLSSPSEQVAYLLVERATLLERLEAAERRLDNHSLTGNLREVQLQQELEHIRHTMGEELRQQRADAQKTKDNMTKCSSQSPWRKLFGLRRSGPSKHIGAPVHSEEISREQGERQRLERDLEEASSRLAMAHQDIRRLTNELDAARNNNLGFSGSELERAGQEVENLRKEVDKLKHCDMVELHRAKERNERFDVEIRALRDRVRTLDSEKKQLQEMLAKNEAVRGAVVKEEDHKEKDTGTQPQNNFAGLSAEDKDHVHKRCREAVEDGLVQVRELQRRLQRQLKEQEELVERNEELEALLGEAQNASKEERQRHEGELEGMHRRIKSLESELKKQGAQDKPLKNGEEGKETESFLQQLRGSSQERVALLEARLTEEKEWRKQLEVDLTAAQAALKKDKEALQIGERELKKLRLEVNGLQTECQQGKTLIKSLTQVKGEKVVLEEKVAQLERAQSRLQSELERHKDSGWTQEDLRESRLQVDLLREQADRLTAELTSLKTAHNTLRDEMVTERRKTSELQAELSSRVQEKLAAEGERERLELEVQRLRKQLQWQQEQLSSRQETPRSSQEPETHTDSTESSASPTDKAKDEGNDQLSCLKQELSHLQAILDEERQLAAQHQLALQAQANEAQAHTKSQGSVLSQKAEETKQLKQDLQRAQSLFTSAERELRYEREKNMDLKRHNTLLDQEKLKLCAELKQAQAKLVQVELNVQSQTAECERQQHKLRELELELARNATSRNATTSLQEELQAERARLIAADKKVLELQQQLKSVQHQLRVEEARAGESSRLERDSRDLSDTLSALRAQQQEEHITRKLLEQREVELQQQVRSLRQKEASLARTNAEISHRAQQLDTRLAILEAEHSKAREEEKDSQRAYHRRQEELVASQQECDRLQGELQQVLLQLDTQIRKYNEKQGQHKTKLRQAKQIYLKATAQRDHTIQKLENDLALASSLSHKEKEWIQTVMEENEKLLAEKRELLRKMSEAEEMGSNGLRTASTVQHRVNVLEVENRQLQDRTLKLSNQVSSLERALRNVQSFYSLESAKKTFPSESLSDAILHTSALSVTSGTCDPLSILDAICRVKVGERVEESNRGSISTPQPQPSELGYLNLTSPVVLPGTREPEERPNSSGKV
ncbi:coiled-coil domain-containing protein 30 isoform X2 [Myripristis murdjan]|uniref:coiled-coil domain-containing protein 30 isoform X2 n=1 Tax=Myripristis murdjan TaxID=586833 RepID=UPI0011760011|nr:coiled-coil domain-containing protein 30 isoform X2 [Myripristis murdjan]